ncbi:MAG: MaoC family dehydratase N-terminal domain-containing protein [Xanthomonadales bacterium]|nr:MaoC family dehydratase N-terminal domain-containing protein [Xanthomonadales bacterium]
MTIFNREYLGHVSEPASVQVELGQLRLFAKAIGETRDIYLDEAAARQAGYRSVLAPPSFGTCLWSLAPRTGPDAEELGIDYRYLLHGEESFSYQGLIFAGDTITLQDRIDKMYEKKGGAMDFMELVATATNQLGEQVQQRRTTLIMRRPQA